MGPVEVTKDCIMKTVVKFLNEPLYQSVIFLYVIVFLYTSYLRFFVLLFLN